VKLWLIKLWKTAFHPIGARRPMGFRAEDSIKNTPDGEVTLRLGRSEGTLKIEVVDTGIGIKPEHRDLVFMKFYRTTDSRLHSSGKTKFMGAGPGLGLYLVCGIIEAHGGSVRIEDNHNGVPKPGTNLWFNCPNSDSGKRRWFWSRQAESLPVTNRFCCLRFTKMAAKTESIFKFCPYFAYDLQSIL
jgi:hypothetical protein